MVVQVVQYQVMVQVLEEVLVLLEEMVQVQLVVLVVQVQLVLLQVHQ